MTSSFGYKLNLINYEGLKSSLIVMGVGIWFLFMVGGPNRITCDRRTDQCKIGQERWLRSDDKQIVPLEIIEEARMTRHESENNTLYGTVLETEEGTIRVSGHTSAWRSSHERAVHEINQFLENPGKQSIDRRFGQIFFIFMSFPLLLGVSILFSTHLIIEVTVNAPVRVMKLKRRRWWQNKGPENYINLDQIARVEVDTYREGMKPSDSRYVTEIVLRSGEIIPIFRCGKSKLIAKHHANRLKTYLEKFNQSQD